MDKAYIYWIIGGIGFIVIVVVVTLIIVNRRKMCGFKNISEISFKEGETNENQNNILLEDR